MHAVVLHYLHYNHPGAIPASRSLVEGGVPPRFPPTKLTACCCYPPRRTNIISRPDSHLYSTPDIGQTTSCSLNLGHRAWEVMRFGLISSAVGGATKEELHFGI